MAADNVKLALLLAAAAGLYWMYRKLTEPVPLPEGWREQVDPSSGNTFYHQAATGVSTWDRQAAERGTPRRAPRAGNAVPGRREPAEASASHRAAVQISAAAAPRGALPRVVQISAAARDDLDERLGRLVRASAQLPGPGRQLLEALTAEIQAAMADHAQDRGRSPHFESGLRREIEARVGAVDHLERLRGSPGAWSVSGLGGFGGPGYVLSIRTEVLGAPPGEAFDALARLRSSAAGVRNTLLGDGAAWMRRLSRRDADYGDFLAAAKHSGGAAYAGAHPQRVDSGPLCDFCDAPLGSALLGGAHKCRVGVTYRC